MKKIGYRSLFLNVAIRRYLMVSTIGVMIGFYILARMAEMLDLRHRSTAMTLLAWVTILVSIFGILDLLFRSTPQ